MYLKGKLLRYLVFSFYLIIRYLLFDFITKIYFYLHFSISNKMKSEFLIYHRTIYHLYHSILYSYLFYLLLLFQIIKRLTNESFQLISRTRFQIFLFQIDRFIFHKSCPIPNRINISNILCNLANFSAI